MKVGTTGSTGGSTLPMWRRSESPTATCSAMIDNWYPDTGEAAGSSAGRPDIDKFETAMRRDKG